MMRGIVDVIMMMMIIIMRRRRRSSTSISQGTPSMRISASTGKYQNHAKTIDF